jgi:predicted glycosyltransferase
MPTPDVFSLTFHDDVSSLVERMGVMQMRNDLGMRSILDRIEETREDWRNPATGVIKALWQSHQQEV